MKSLKFKSGIFTFFFTYALVCFVYSYNYDWDVNPIQFFGFTLQGIISLGFGILFVILTRKNDV